MNEPGAQHLSSFGEDRFAKWDAARQAFLERRLGLWAMRKAHPCPACGKPTRALGSETRVKEPDGLCRRAACIRARNNAPRTWLPPCKWCGEPTKYRTRSGYCTKHECRKAYKREHKRLRKMAALERNGPVLTFTAPDPTPEQAKTGSPVLDDFGVTQRASESP